MDRGSNKMVINMAHKLQTRGQEADPCGRMDKNTDGMETKR